IRARSPRIEDPRPSAFPRCSPMKLGINLAPLGLPVRRGLAEASKAGAAGVQLDATGDLAPDRLSDTGRRELLHLLRSYNLELTALGAPLRHALDVAHNQEARIDYLGKVMTLSFDLGPRVVVVQAGRVPDKPDDPRAARMTEALLALGHHGDRTGTTLALETGLEAGEALRDFLARLDTGGLGVNYDPANLLLNGFDPIANLTPLRHLLKHVHAHDARLAAANRVASEVPLGAGDIDWMQFLATLSALEYRGWVVVAGEPGTDKLGDVIAGVSSLRRLLP